MVRHWAGQLGQARRLLRDMSETGVPAWVYLHHVSIPWWAPSIQATACNKVPPRASAHAHAHLQEDLASLLTDMRRARMPAAAVQHVATMLGMEGRQPPKAAGGRHTSQP